MKNSKNTIKDRRVLSVSAAKTYAHMTEHNVYSCPDDFSPHDPAVEAFAPRNQQGKIPRLYCIVARIVTNPKKPVFPPNLKPEYAQSISAYICAVSHIKGILDGGGNYRFYVLRDLENGALNHSPTVNLTEPLHVYLSLKDLVSGSPVVRPTA
jgi:hypothetical protein